MACEAPASSLSESPMGTTIQASRIAFEVRGDFLGAMKESSAALKSLGVCFLHFSLIPISLPPLECGLEQYIHTPQLALLERAPNGMIVSGAYSHRGCCEDSLIPGRSSPGGETPDASLAIFCVIATGNCHMRAARKDGKFQGTLPAIQPAN